MTGKITQISGSIIDVRFDADHMPRIKEALTVTYHGEKRVMEVESTGKAIMVPVGEATLGRMFNVLGEPIDGLGEMEPKTEKWERLYKPTIPASSPMAPLAAIEPPFRSCYALTLRMHIARLARTRIIRHSISIAFGDMMYLLRGA